MSKERLIAKNLTNQEISKLFGLGYSSISRRATIMKSRISKEGIIYKKFNKINSLIKM